MIPALAEVVENTNTAVAEMRRDKCLTATFENAI